MTFRQKFAALGLLLLAGFALLIWSTRSTLHEVMVTGPLYQRAVEGQELVADILPPPKFIVETHLLVHQLVDAQTDEQRTAFLKRLAECEVEYADRQAHWATNLDQRNGGMEGTLAWELLHEAHDPANAYFKVVHDSLLPALQSGDSAAARRVLIDELNPLFATHRIGIDRSVAAAHQVIAEREREAVGVVSRGQAWALGLGIGILVAVALAGGLAFRSVLRSIDTVSERLRVMSDGEADLTSRLGITTKDEAGRLARYVDAFVAKIGGLVSQAKESALSLKSMSQVVHDTSREQEATVQQFGASTAQIAAAVQEISATQADLVRTMDAVQKVAESSADIASSGRERLGEMAGAMQSLAASSASISERLTTINDRTQDISAIVVAITKVADQTNLLSVNAAIEAEKAGEAGRGFLVVAREIRRLADQTAQATLDIERMVASTQAAVSAGVMEMDKFTAEVHSRVHQVGTIGHGLGAVIDGVAEMKERFAGLGEGMSSQAVGAQQISEAMGSLSGNVRSTVASLADFTHAAERMRSAVAALDRELSKFRVASA